MKSIKGLLAVITAVFLVMVYAVLSSIIVGVGDVWYAALIKPHIWLRGMSLSIIRDLIFVSAILALSRMFYAERIGAGCMIYLVAAIASLVFSGAFFGTKNLPLACFLSIVTFLLFALSAISLLYRDATACLLVVPTVLWSFALAIAVFCLKYLN